MLDRLFEALAAYDRGWWLTPVHQRKRPYLKGWSEQPRCTREEVLAWATAGNVAVRMGVTKRADGFVLIGVDFDTYKHRIIDPKTGEPMFDPAFLNVHNEFKTLWAFTHQGGYHAYVWAPPNISNSTSRFAKGVDVRARGGCLVLPGGDGYTWLNGGPEAVDEAGNLINPIATIPDAWLDRLGARGKLSRAASAVKNAPEGTRNDTLNKEAWKLRAEIETGGVTESEVRSQLARASPLPPTETDRTLDSALSVRVTSDERQILAPGIHANGLVSPSLDFTKRVLSAVPPDRFYLRGGVLGEIVGQRWEPVSTHRMRGVVDDYVQVKYLKDKGERGVITETGHITDEHAKLIIANATSAAVTRNLKALCPHPVFTRQLDVLGPGWHPKYELLIQDCEIASTPIDPRTLLVDFPLDEPSYANLIAFIYTLAGRAAIGDVAPAFVVTAAQERIGKSKLCNDFGGGIILGGPLPSDTWPEDADEVRKVLFAAALGGSEVLLVDNVPCRLDSPQLASFVTSKLVAGRLLGRSVYIQVPNLLTIVVTGNRIAASQEIAKRCCIINLDVTCESPELRDGFVHSDLARAVLDARAGIWRWMVDRLEHASTRSTLRLGGFETWAEYIGRVLHDMPVLGNRDAFVADMTEEADDIAPLVDAWSAVAPHEWLVPHEVVEIATRLGWGGERFDPIKSTHGRIVAMGRVLRSHVGRVYGPWRLYRKTAKGGSALYALMPVR